jgi:hypothetical protein
VDAWPSGASAHSLDKAFRGNDIDGGGVAARLGSRGLFWTLVYVWARQQDPPMVAWDGSVRQNLAVEAAASWDPLQRYFSSTLCRRELLHPSVCMAKYVKARSEGDHWETWRDAVRAIEACNGWLSCPEKLLQKVFAEGAVL